MSARGDAIGLAVVARDEEAVLPRLLASIEGCFDQVVLLDTGSTDATVERFESWAAAERGRAPGFSATVGHFAWRDDFAAARNAADALLTTGWRAWADADDEIRGAQHLRRIAAQAPPQLAGLVAGYETDHMASGEVQSYSQRVRLVRAGTGRWHNPVHEALLVDGDLAAIDPKTTVWVHRKPDGRDGGHRRNLELLLAWLGREPDNPRALVHCGRDHAALGDHESAVGAFRRYIEACEDWNMERVQVHRQLASSLLALGRLDEAAAVADAAARAVPGAPDGHLALAESALAAGDAAATIAHARRVLELGPPQGPLLHVSTDYTARPRLLIARALRLQGDGAQSRRLAEDALLALGPEPSR